MEFAGVSQYIYFQMLGYISLLLSLKSSYGCKACDRPYRSNSSDAAWSLISLIFHVFASLIMMIAAVPIASLIFSPSSVHLVDKAQIHLYLEKAQEIKSFVTTGYYFGFCINFHVCGQVYMFCYFLQLACDVTSRTMLYAYCKLLNLLNLKPTWKPLLLFLMFSSNSAQKASNYASLSFNKLFLPFAPEF